MTLERAPAAKRDEADLSSCVTIKLHQAGLVKPTAYENLGCGFADLKTYIYDETSHNIEEKQGQKAFT